MCALIESSNIYGTLKKLGKTVGNAHQKKPELTLQVASSYYLDWSV